MSKSVCVSIQHLFLPAVADSLIEAGASPSTSVSSKQAEMLAVLKHGAGS